MALKWFATLVWKTASHRIGTHRVTENLEFTGHWWLPGVEERKFPGTLRFEPGKGIFLKILGSLSSSVSGKDYPGRNFPLLLGTTSREQFFTLRNSCNSERVFGWWGGAGESSYDVEYAISGASFPSNDSTRFRRLYVFYSGLARWIDKPTFSPAEYLNLMGRPTPLTLHADSSVQVVACRVCTLIFNYGPTVQCQDSRTLAVVPWASVEFCFAQDTSLDSTMSVILAVRDFLAFAVAAPVHIQRVQTIPVVHSLYRDPQDVRIYHKSFVGDTHQTEVVRPLLVFGEIEDVIQGLIASWVAKREVLCPVMDLYLGLQYKPELSEYTRFLNVAQALEAFHRRMRCSNELPPEAHEARIRQVLESAPEEHRDWLAQKLEYSNEVTFRKRLKTVFDEYKDILSRFAIDRRDFINQAYSVRNHLTHYDPRAGSEMPAVNRMHGLTDGLSLLLDLCLLSEIGLPRDRLARCVARSHPFRLAGM
jgi:hypothetical protein